MYIIKWSSQFKKDYKRFLYNNKLLSEIDNTILLLASWDVLDKKFKDHSLSWQYLWCRECHVKPDVLLVYKYDKEDLLLLLVRVGSHSDLF
jgi:mRNA interferase YafQ